MDDIKIIELEFTVGQKVCGVILEQTPTYRDCETCEGEGVLYTKSGRNPVQCPKCRGEKRISTSGSLDYQPKEGIVERISVDVAGGNYKDITYYVLLNDGEKARPFKDGTNELFETYKYAKERCDKMNSQGIMGYTQ
jgi:hypothetical protein